MTFKRDHLFAVQKSTYSPVGARVTVGSCPHTPCGPGALPSTVPAAAPHQPLSAESAAPEHAVQRSSALAMAAPLPKRQLPEYAVAEYSLVNHDKVSFVRDASH